MLFSRSPYHDCDAIAMRGFGVGNELMDLRLRFEGRGVYADGKTPLPPDFDPASAFSPGFTCFCVEIRDVSPV